MRKEEVAKANAKGKDKKETRKNKNEKNLF